MSNPERWAFPLSWDCVGREFREFRASPIYNFMWEVRRGRDNCVTLNQPTSLIHDLLVVFQSLQERSDGAELLSNRKREEIIRSTYCWLLSLGVTFQQKG